MNSRKSENGKSPNIRRFRRLEQEVRLLKIELEEVREERDRWKQRVLNISELMLK